MENEAVYEQKQESMKRLNKYASVINLVLSDYSRKSTDETMMIKGFRKSNIESTNRKTHSENLEAIATVLAERLNLNVPVVRLMAKYHDIGHTFLGHSGEWWLSEIKKNEGLGCYVHNSLGVRNLLYTDQVVQEIKDTLYKVYTDNSKEKNDEIEKVCDEDLWIIFDGINSHNGELSESVFEPNKQKTKKDFEEELMNCHVKEDYDRTLSPGTTEGCLMRLCDKISYIPYDMVDGLREGIIDGLDEEYMDVLVSILINDKQMTPEAAVNFINSCVTKQEYNALAHKLQAIFVKDAWKNSNEERIAMSDKMSGYMHQLRDINNNKVVKYVLMQEDHEVYPKALREMAGECASIIKKEKILENLNGANRDLLLTERLLEKYKDSPYLGFVNFIAKTNQADFEWTEKMLKRARAQAIENDLDESLESVKKMQRVSFVKGQEKRIRRIHVFADACQKQIDGLKSKGYSIGDKDYANIKEFQKKKLAPQLYASREDSMAFEFGTKYLASLSDSEFMDLLKTTGKVNKGQYKRLTRKYSEIDLEREYMTHGQWDKIAEEQSKAAVEENNWGPVQV